MTEFILHNATRNTKADPDKDRIGCHKKGDLQNYKPDGWSDHPNWQQSKYPEKFVGAT